MSFAPYSTLLASQMSLARIPAIVATSMAGVRLRVWSLHKSNEMFSAAPFTAHLAIEKNFVLTTSAFSTPYRLLDQKSALRSDPLTWCEILFFKNVSTVATLSALDAILADACVRAVVR